LGEHFCLSDGILAGGSVEDEQYLIRSVWDFSGYHIADFCELLH
jgi:hypothetical protein